MTPVIRRSMIMTMIAGLVLVGSLAYSNLVLLPAMQGLRQTIDDGRADTIVRQQEQSNLEALGKDIANLQAQQEALDVHIWSFATEEQFFELWETMATAQAVEIGQPKVADVTPKNQPINRAITLVITGSLTRVTATMAAIQKLDPLVVIEKLTIKNGTLTDVVATVDAQTLWQ